MSQERRLHPRISLRVDVDVQSESNFFVGKTRDISLGGLFIETNVPLPIGSELAVEMLLAGKRHTMTAEVTWSLFDAVGACAGVGVRFVDLPTRAESAIRAFMNKREPESFEMSDPEPEVTTVPRPQHHGGPPPLPPAAAHPVPPPLPRSSS